MEIFLNKEQLDPILRVLQHIDGGINDYRLLVIQIVSTLALLVTTFFTFLSARAAQKSAQLGKEAIEETRKERYIGSMPIIRVIAMERRKNKRGPEYYLKNPGAQTPESQAYAKKHTEHHAVEYENIGKGLANVSRVQLWVGNSLPDYEISLIKYHYKSVLYSKEKDEIAHSNVFEPEAINIDKFPQKVRIVYKDIWGHEIIYTATKKTKIASCSFPFVGLEEYIEHAYEYPSELK